jgi:hypothetical protein
LKKNIQTFSDARKKFSGKLSFLWPLFLEI